MDMRLYGFLAADNIQRARRKPATAPAKLNSNGMGVSPKFTGTFIDVEGRRLVYTKQHEVMAIFE